MARAKSTLELTAELDALRAKTRDVAKLLAQKKREEDAAAAKAAYETEVSEAMAVLAWSKTARLSNGQSIYEAYESWKIQQCNPDGSAT